MNRLQSELQRLYRSPVPGQVRALLLELAGPAEWRPLAGVWRGVQADLGLPAPAIAVSGHDGLQLWFSLQAPVSAARGADFLGRLCAHYLPDLAPGRLRLQPAGPDAPAPVPAIPAQWAATGNWSAFVAPDLAPVFADTPWLDVEPGVDGQADLLARLAGIEPAAFVAAMSRLAPARPAAPDGSPPSDPAQPAGTATDVDPRRFLQQLLNDETQPLALRVEAAKALLQAQAFSRAG